MAQTDTFVSVIVPLDNDADLLEPYLLELGAVLKAGFRDYEIVLVDDASADGTRGLVDRLLAGTECLRYVRLARRRGLDVATTAGLDTVIGDYVVVIEPGCDPPEDIPRMVAACRQGADVVVGTCDGRHGEARLFWLGRRVFYWLCRRLITDRLPASATHFLCLSRRAVNAVTRVKQHHRHLGVVACSVGHATTLLPYCRRATTRGSRQRGLGSALEYGVSTLVTNSVSPLRLVTYIGAFAGLCNLLYMVYVCAVNFFKDRVAEGWTTLSLQMSGMFFLVFLALAVISEYLVQTFQASKDPPLYHVLEERSSLRPFVDAGRRNVVQDSQRAG